MLVVALQSIGSLGLALSRYEQYVEEHGWKKDEETIGVIISRGFALTELVKLANSIFGELIMVQYLVSLFFTVFGIYFSTCVFDVYTSMTGQVNEFLLIFCIANIALVVLNLYQLYIMQGQGQKLCDHFSGIRANLEAASINLSKSLDQEKDRKLQVLIARYSATTNSPMRPCDVFNMNAANFVSIGGIILTYIIVLLQFKHSYGSNGGGGGGEHAGLNMNFDDIRSFMRNKTIDDLRAFLNNRTSAGAGGGLFKCLTHDRHRLRLADRFGHGY